ncbi:MAG: hypothetical protein RIT81_09460 [Deltaproteobacteria bacterium]
MNDREKKFVDEAVKNLLAKLGKVEDAPAPTPARRPASSDGFTRSSVSWMERLNGRSTRKAG